MPEKFSEKFLATVGVPKEKRVRYSDSSTSGLVLDVQPSGKKSFGWYRKVRGVATYRAIDTKTVKEARDVAEGWNADLRDWKNNLYQGANPFGRELPAAEAASVPTFSALVEKYVLDQVKTHANNPTEAEYELRNLVNGHLASWNDRAVDSITVEDVLAAKNKCGERRVRANRVVQCARRLFNWAGKKKDGRVNFWPIEKNPAAAVSLFEEKERERFLKPAELAKFNEQLKQLRVSNHDLHDFLVLALTTGARRSNVFAMRWCDVDFERGVWEIPFSKNGEGYTVSLLPAAVETLERRREEIAEDESFVFPSHSKSGHVEDLKKGWNDFRKAAGVPDIRIHDIRRSVGAYLAMSGANLPAIAAVLGHRSLAAVKVYARYAPEATHQARLAGQAKMLELMTDAEKRAKRITAKRPEKLLAAAVARG